MEVCVYTRNAQTDGATCTAMLAQIICKPDLKICFQVVKGVTIIVIISPQVSKFWVMPSSTIVYGSALAGVH